MFVAGEKIRMAREAKGMSQEAVADLLGISQTAYSDIERGKTQPKLNRLQQLADIFEIDIQEILRPNSHITLHIDNNHGTQGINLSGTDLHEHYNKLIEAKDKQISLLEELLEQYRKSGR
jgi:transcriptional regulator with XRE-family HTH domain